MPRHREHKIMTGDCAQLATGQSYLACRLATSAVCVHICVAQHTAARPTDEACSPRLPSVPRTHYPDHGRAEGVPSYFEHGMTFPVQPRADSG